MDGDFNKLGEQYHYMAVGEQRLSYAILQPETSEYLTLLHQKISQKWQDENEPDKVSMKNLYGCIQRLKSFLFIATQLVTHVQQLYKTPLPQPGSLAFLAIDEVNIYFESLLFHGRAALDRLTAYVAPIHKQRHCDKFSKLRNVLTHAAKTNTKAQDAINVIDKASPFFHGLILDTDITKALRSALIHRCSIGEITVIGLTINRLKDGKFFLFDQEIQYGAKNPAFPIIQSAWLLCQYIPFVILNILALYLEVDSQLSLETCEPLWRNRFIAFNQFIEPTGDGIKLSVIKVLPGRFTVITKTLNTKVLKFAYELPIDGTGNTKA